MGTAWTTTIVSHHRKGVVGEGEREREDHPWKVGFKYNVHQKARKPEKRMEKRRLMMMKNRTSIIVLLGKQRELQQKNGMNQETYVGLSLWRHNRNMPWNRFEPSDGRKLHIENEPRTGPKDTEERNENERLKIECETVRERLQP